MKQRMQQRFTIPRSWDPRIGKQLIQKSRDKKIAPGLDALIILMNLINVYQYHRLFVFSNFIHY